MSAVLLPTAYLPNLSYVVSCLNTEKIILESHEHFIKQTYRNRTSVYGANGKLDLIVPVVHDNLYSQPIHEVHIATGHSWKKIHWRSIESAYRNSAYFEYYEDELKKLFHRPVTTVFEWNLGLMEFIFEHLEIPFRPVFTESFQETYPGNTVDMRIKLKPGEESTVRFPPYFQVFSSKHGFIPDLSAVDLLFNLGKESKAYLQSLSNTD